jgi:hypothetical protein
MAEANARGYEQLRNTVKFDVLQRIPFIGTSLLADINKDNLQKMTLCSPNRLLLSTNTSGVMWPMWVAAIHVSHWPRKNVETRCSFGMIRLNYTNRTLAEIVTERDCFRLSVATKHTPIAYYNIHRDSQQITSLSEL